MVGRQVERLIVRIRTMDREELIRFLRELDCGFEMDLTSEYLASMSLERLRHVVTAACLHAQSLPPRVRWSSRPA